MKIYKTMDNGIQIVEYEDSLAPQIADMWNKSSDSWGGENSITTAEQVIKTNSGGSFFNTFIAMHNGEAVGFCSFDRYYKDADTLYVHVLNVRPDYHGKKVGKELVLHCVNRTIELGYPRLDIHTWAGNTKAVPLYKKCGFLWEDRADSTHLSNYIPTVLKTELFSGFFEKAHWYNDSTRAIEIKPDGVKVNKFESYGYSWEKDGQPLSVDFEKTGRRIRYAETNDYKIEFMAENHELAFGLPYNCSFKIENKSDSDLNIKIKGKDNREIKFDYEAEKTVPQKSSIILESEFFVGAITEELDTWRMHPCILADVYINGKHAEFGLGIEPKYPLKIELIEKRLIAKEGMTEDVYINVKSALSKKADVQFSMPANQLSKFHDSNFSLTLCPSEIKTIITKADIISCGYEGVPVTYNIKLENGTETSFTKTLHLTNQGLDSMFASQTDAEHIAVSGTWRIVLFKDSNHVTINRLSWKGYAQFSIPKLGKPYDDEFNIEKPSDVRIFRGKNENGFAMVMEADFDSKKFAGITLTETYTLTPSGIATRHHRVKNNSDIQYELFIREEMWSNVGRRSVFHYDGEIHEISDSLSFGISNIHSEKIDENWIFDNTPNNPCGIYWPREYKPSTKWGDTIAMEYSAGVLSLGDCYETKPIVYINGLFNSFREFRNYVLGIDEAITPYTSDYVEIVTNNYNPFITAGELPVTIRNNKLTILEGEISVSSKDGLFECAAQTNPPKEIYEKNEFNLSLTDKRNDIRVCIAKVNLKLASFEKKKELALFLPDNNINIEKTGLDSELTVKNGKLSFGVTSGYKHSLHSLKYNEDEWIFSKCDDPQPYSWWNPFIGGIHSSLPQMNSRLVLNEKASSSFAEETDCFGNKWTGICTKLDITEFEKLKGVSYEQYYMTMPGLPVLCYFVKLINESGGYKSTEINTAAFISGKENLKSVCAEFSDDEKNNYRIRCGSDDKWQSCGKLVKVSYDGDVKRNEKLYIFKDFLRDNGSCGMSSDINFMCVNNSTWLSVANGSHYTTRPTFFILSDQELTQDSLKDLERIAFN